MIFWIASVAGLAIAYLFGSIPTGYLAGKLLRGIDIRRHGSKSTGATNVLRTLGKGPALFVLVGDVLKGVGAIIVARSFCPWLYAELSSSPTASDLQLWVPWAVCLAGIAVLLGHSRDLAELHGRQVGCRRTRCVAGDVLARWIGGCSRLWLRAGYHPDRFLELDARGVDGNRSCLRGRAPIAVPVAGDRRRPLRDHPPSCEHPKTF